MSFIDHGKGGGPEVLVPAQTALPIPAADEVLIETAPGAFGNLEGLSVWRDAGGSLRLTLVADDNFLFLLGTDVVEFTVPD
jgi:hypothetical protein